MKGQVTFEYMVLSLVVLVLLSISITALIAIRENSSKAMDVVLFKSSATDLYNTIEEVCAMGDGNSLEVYLRRDVSVDYDGNNVKFSSPLPHVNGTITRSSICEVEAKELPTGAVIVSNNNGTIEIKEKT